MATMTETTVFHVTNCPECGMAFAMTSDFECRRREDHSTFYCPAGHKQYYAQKSKAEQLAEQLEREQARADRNAVELTRSIQAHQNTARRLSATRGVVTRTRRRIANGVCPCCSRHFTDLHRHMETKHPNYEGAEA